MKKLLTAMLTIALSVVTALSLTACGKVTYKDLQIVELNAETEYLGIAFRKGSNVTRKVEVAIQELIGEKKLDPLASKYGVAGVSSYTPAAAENADSSDWATIQGKGKLVIGITDYKPMDYQEENSKEWIGFDADLAKLVCEKLGIGVEFIEINWDNKLIDLASGKIDCIWNGMTITDEVLNGADCTAPYMENRQVAVVKKSNADKYSDVSKMTKAKIACESGSAGAKYVQNNDSIKNCLIEVEAQSDAFLEVMSGKSDVAIVDYMMAKALIEG